MRRAIGILLAATTLGAVTLTNFFREGNTIFLRLSDGSAQVEWLSDSSFRFSRNWDGNFVQGPAVNPQPVVVSVNETADSLVISSKYLALTIAKQGVLVHAAEPNGAVIMSDLSEAERQDGSIAWERSAPLRARFFGLGTRTDSTVELRGSRMAAKKPFLLSTLGYGELHVAAGDYSFDVARAKPDRYRIEARHASKIDYYFFYGPAPKEVFEQLLLLNGSIARLSPSQFDLLKLSEVPKEAPVLSSASLADAIRSLINGSLSGTPLMALSLDSAPDTLRRRAIQLGSVSPLVSGSNRESMRGTIRGELTAYLTTYAEEARERGLPLLRALPMQFSRDPEAAKVSDQFMFGDELLVAPIYDGRNSRSVYLPMGVWTRLSNNEVYQGRRTITIDAGPDELPLFSRNGAVLPLGSDPMKLHYFPKLGGEFFLFEHDLGEYSQVHAGPAGDFMRLEIESKKDREYEWIVHHIERPKKIAAGESVYSQARDRNQLRQSSWFYDAQAKNLHVRAMGPAGADVIINISF